MKIISKLRKYEDIHWLKWFNCPLAAGPTRNALKMESFVAIIHSIESTEIILQIKNELTIFMSLFSTSDGDIDVGDECWRQNVLVTSLSYW